MYLPQAIPITAAASALGISTSTIYRMKGRGDIRTEKVASRTMVPLSEIHRILGISETLTSPEGRDND